MRARLLVTGTIVLALVGSVVTDSEVLRPPLRVDRDDRAIDPPKVQEVSELYAITRNSWLRHLNVEYQVNLARRQPALNVNAWDEVPDSSWFTNRIGRRPMTFADIAAGLEGHAPGPGRIRIGRIKDEGYTPGFDVEDAGGQPYVLKLDLPDAIERNSGAERLSTLVLHAAGYNVPHNSIVHFAADDLWFDERSTYRNAVGERRAMTAEDLVNALGRVRAGPDGRFRALASLRVPGQAIGKFKYDGVRKDDPNDIIPHDLRRELRGFRVIASWINHVDVGDKNTLDVYDQNGSRSVKHYLLDFGSTLGSGNFVNGPFRVGHEYIFDGRATWLSFATLGAWERPWEREGVIRYPEVGYFDAALFEPARWKPNYPNLAFVRMDDGDAYWGAKIVTAFDDDTVRELVRAAQYSRPEVTGCVDDALKRRRDAIGQYWLDLVTPLEAPRLDWSADAPTLRFRDLAVERRYADARARSYRVWAETLDGRPLGFQTTVDGYSGVMRLERLPVQGAGARGGRPPDRYRRVPALRVFVQTNRTNGGWARPFEMIIGSTLDDPTPQVLGWTHGARSKHAGPDKGRR